MFSCYGLQIFLWTIVYYSGGSHIYWYDPTLRDPHSIFFLHFHSCISVYFLAPSCVTFRQLITPDLSVRVSSFCFIIMLFGLFYLAFWFEIWNNLPTRCNWVFICVLSARHVSGLHVHLQEQWMLQFLYICSIRCSWFSLVRCRSWGLCVLVACCTATRHQHTHSSGPTPNYTKDTICYICKRNYNMHCSWRWACKPETCRAKRTQINTQLRQVGKLFHISNQNARYN